MINYGVPLTTKSYRHRVGRTARAGRCGTAVTIVTRDDGKAYLELESALLPTKPGELRRTIPRYPHKLPPERPAKSSAGEVGMETRRRLAQEAWTRAAKVCILHKSCFSLVVSREFFHEISSLIVRLFARRSLVD